MEYIGFDYHKQFTIATGLDAETGEKRWAKLANTSQAIKGFIKDSATTHAVLEASRTWGVLYDILKDSVASVKLAHPLRVKAIAAARIKNDKIDSRILAELLAADLIPEAHIREGTNRTKQSIVRQRVFFFETRTRVKNRIHVLIDRQSYEVRKYVEGMSDLFGKAGMDWLRNHVKLSKDDRILLNQLLEFLDIINKLISQSDAYIRQVYKEDHNAQLLSSIPGIGSFLAVLISTEIDDIHRFDNGDKLASYTGLVPSTYASGKMVHHGRITKQGNKWLRWAFTEAATNAKKTNIQLQEYYTEIKHRRDKHRAKIALARRLVKITYSMLVHNRPFETYRESNQLKHVS